MNKDALITLPHAHLRAKSRKVSKITPKIRKLAEDMKAVTLDWEDSRKHETGVALAAVQVDRLLNVIVVRSSIENKKDRSFKVLINPRVTHRGREIIQDFEGCLSVSDIYGKVSRYNQVTVEALDLRGKQCSFKVEGFAARVLQHEIDHTKGILFIDRIKHRRNAFFKLNDDGKLEKLDYEKHIRNNPILW